MSRYAIISVLALIACSLALAADHESECQDLIRQSEQSWVKLDYDGSDRPLLRARELCPDRAEIYWRMARNEYDRIEMIPREQKPDKDELLECYGRVEKLAEKCMALDGDDGNCWLWKAVAIGRRGSTQGVLKTVFEVDDMENAMLQAVQRKPQYRSSNGAASSMADLYCMLGIFYRVLPEWTCAFPFKQVIGTCGDLDKSLEYHMKALQREPHRIEFHKELGVTYMCRGVRRESREDMDRAREVLQSLQDMAEFKTTDQIDKQHSRMIIDDPDMACGYSRDAQQEQDKEAFTSAIKVPQ